jgi:hypothetical protein
MSQEIPLSPLSSPPSKKQVELRDDLHASLRAARAYDGTRAAEKILFQRLFALEKRLKGSRVSFAPDGPAARIINDLLGIAGKELENCLQEHKYPHMIRVPRMILPPEVGRRALLKAGGKTKESLTFYPLFSKLSALFLNMTCI